MNEKKPVAVHLVTPYLFHTGSWVYSQLTGMEKFSNVVFTQRKENLESFPFQDLFSPEDFGFVKEITNKMYRRLTDNYGLYFGSITRRIKPCLFHAHMGFEGARWLRFVQRTRIPLITTFYGLDVSQLGQLDVWRKRYEVLFDYGTVFLAEGTFLKKQLVDLGCPSDKIIVQHLGVPATEYPKRDGKKKNSDSPIIILQAATFREKKGLEYSLQAIARVVEAEPNVEYRLIGSGDSMEADRAIMTLVENLGIRQHVKLLGSMTHRATIEEMLAADIFLQPSVTAANGDNEGGAPVSIIEASAVGLPIVATLHADIPEVVRNGETGFLVPERDSAALAKKLLELIHAPDTRMLFGRGGQRHILSEYNLSVQIKKLEDIYSHVKN